MGTAIARRLETQRMVVVVVVVRTVFTIIVK
jgi:hypothetical protein